MAMIDQENREQRTGVDFAHDTHLFFHLFF